LIDVLTSLPQSDILKSVITAPNKGGKMFPFLIFLIFCDLLFKLEDLENRIAVVLKTVTVVLGRPTTLPVHPVNAGYSTCSFPRVQSAGETKNSMPGKTWPPLLAVYNKAIPIEALPGMASFFKHSR
jgi:hypothetical protein